MILKIKYWWKYSTLRFYYLNAKHNYNFWLNSKRVYRNIDYLKSNSFRNNSYERKVSRRFVGYEYKGRIYLDNPGLTIKDRDVWERWKQKRLI